MQSGNKRESSEPAKEDTKKPKQAKDSIDIDEAIRKNRETKESAERDFESGKKSLSEARCAVLMSDAVYNILAFMKLHQTGRTSVLHVKDEESNSILIGALEKYMSVSDINLLLELARLFPDTTKIPTSKQDMPAESKEAIEIVEELLGKDSFLKFSRSVITCSTGTVCIDEHDKIATVKLGIHGPQKITCRRENLIQVGSGSFSSGYVYFTNPRKKYL